MAIIVEMPRLTDTMTEGTLAGWLKVVGDTVDTGDALADVETDKAIMTFESFDDGVLLHLFIAEGDTVPLGTPMALLGDADEDVSALVAELGPKVAAAMAGAGAVAPESTTPAAATPQPAAATPQPAAATPEPTPASPSPAPVPLPQTDAGGALAPAFDDAGARILASPLARRIAAQGGVDLSTIQGTGPRGRIVKRDVDGLEPTRIIRRGGQGREGRGLIAREDAQVRVTQMRKTIARRLAESKYSAPHYYLTMTADCDRLVALRKELNGSQGRVKISYNDLVMRACVVALMDHPDVNVGWEGATIRRFAGVHLGFAVAMDAGLITPVIRDADTKGLLSMAQEVRALAGRARDMKLESAEYTGNSFCVSNLGMYGIDHFTAIINPPAACILAVGGLKQEAVVGDDGSVRAGYRMTMTMSCDHRAVDGATGAAFLKALKAVIESPLNLLLD